MLCSFLHLFENIHLKNGTGKKPIKIKNYSNQDHKEKSGHVFLVYVFTCNVSDKFIPQLIISEIGSETRAPQGIAKKI